MRRLLFVALLVLGLMSIIASAATTAVQLATAIMVIAPFVLPLVLKYVPLDGQKMVILSYAVSIAVAVIAGAVSGLFTDATSVPGIIAAGTAVFGLMQLIYGLFKDHATFGPYLTSTPPDAPPAAVKPSA